MTRCHAAATDESMYTSFIPAVSIGRKATLSADPALLLL